MPTENKDMGSWDLRQNNERNVQWTLHKYGVVVKMWNTNKNTNRLVVLGEDKAEVESHWVNQ